MAMKTAVSVVVTHQASNGPVADFLEHDRETFEAAAVAHDNATRNPVFHPSMRTYRRAYPTQEVSGTVSEMLERADVNAKERRIILEDVAGRKSIDERDDAA